jgi:hypothetical protein
MSVNGKVDKDHRRISLLTHGSLVSEHVLDLPQQEGFSKPPKMTKRK